MADDEAAILAAVGSRLRLLRQQRGTTLAQLAEITGISVSTLSRLESGTRRPTLELLLPLARVHQVALDELVGAPATGDPRVHTRPIVRNGVTFLPLSRRPGGLQAFKQIFPPNTPARLRQKTHPGYEWLYVLSGRLRLLLGEHDLILTPGEVAEFDTRVPHSVGNPGPGPAEALALFGPQGERMHVRARPARGQPGRAVGDEAGRADYRAGRADDQAGAGGDQAGAVTGRPRARAAAARRRS